MAPQNLDGVLMAGDPHLTWQDMSTNEDGFILQRRLATSSEWTEVVVLHEGAHDHHDGTAAPATDYVYRVLAFNDAGESDPSNEKSISTD